MKSSKTFSRTTYRVVATQETGEECCVKNGIRDIDTANRLADQADEDHPEWRSVWVERDSHFFHI